MEVPVCGEIKSQADFRRVLADVIRFTSSKIGDGRFVDRRWLRIDKELNAMRLSTAYERMPTEIERQNIDIARFAKSRIMGQGDWNDYVKCLVGLNNYFKAWPPGEPVSVPDVAQMPKMLPKAVREAAALHAKHQTRWHRFWRWVEHNTRVAARDSAHRCLRHLLGSSQNCPEQCVGNLGDSFIPLIGRLGRTPGNLCDVLVGSPPLSALSSMPSKVRFWFQVSLVRDEECAAPVKPSKNVTVAGVVETFEM